MKNNESPIQLNPVATQRASEAIYNQIAEMITSGQIKPGERLPSERTMMEMLGRSRPTIREALRMLERNGLIQIIAGSRGAVVVEPGSRSVQEPLENMLNMSMISSEELLEYRELNEVTTAGWAALRRTEEDLQKERDELLATTPEKIRSLAKYVDAFMEDDCFVVAGNSGKIKENEKMFGCIENLL